MTTRRLATILVADVVGSSRLIEADEAYALEAIREAIHATLVLDAQNHGGRLIKTAGDGALIEFASPVVAVSCAAEVQRKLAERAKAEPEKRRVLLRIGINLGDVVAREDGDLYGDGVNIAARLEAISDPGGVAISGKVHDELQGKLSLPFEDRGEHNLKNIARSVRVYVLAGATKGSVEAAPPPLPGKPSIVVLPFANMSGDPEQEYFADGITEEITTALSRLRWLFVIARNSAFNLRAQRQDLQEIGNRLGVRYILQGSVRRAGERIRMTGMLVEAATGVQLWTERFEGKLEDVFVLQDEITEAVAAAVEPQLRRAEIERAQRKRPDDLTTYDQYLRALAYFWDGGREEVEQALALAYRLMAAEPGYALPYALAAQLLRYRIVQGWASDVAADRVQGARLAHAALERDREDPDVLWMAGHAIAGFTDDRATGLACLDKAIRLNPNSASAWCFSGWARNFVDDWQTAILQFNTAMRLSPLDRAMYLLQSGLGLAHHLGQQFDEAVHWARASVIDRPNWTTGRRVLIASLAHLDRIGEARAEAGILLKYEPDYRIARNQALTPNPGPGWQRYFEGLRKAGLPE